MPAKKSRQRVGVKRPTKPSHVASPASLHLDRSFAQKVRTDRTLPNYESPAKRAAFWANRMKALATYDQEVVDQSLNPISQGSLVQNSQFASANIHVADLNSPPPTLDSQQSLLGPGGIAPPPPPV